MATKILIENSTATGVELIKNDQILRVYARNEVISSVGALNAPKLLLASGIGPKEDLDRLGVEVVADLPVGKNMSDHLNFPIVITGSSNLITNIKTRIPVINLETFPLAGIVSFFSTSGSSKPEWETTPFYFGVSSPILLAYCLTTLSLKVSVCARLVWANTFTEVYLVSMDYLSPYSRGYINTTSLDPSVDPEIHPGFLSDPRDYDEVRRGIRRIFNLTETTYFKKANSKVIDLGFEECASFNFESDDYWNCYVRNAASSNYHPTGTCAMGGVVNNNLQVYGVDKLRIVDACVFPVIPSGNTNAPTLMLGERISDVIKSEYTV